MYHSGKYNSEKVLSVEIRTKSHPVFFIPLINQKGFQTTDFF